jgi:predicted metalloprotease with PDZ domain
MWSGFASGGRARRGTLDKRGGRRAEPLHIIITKELPPLMPSPRLLLAASALALTLPAGTIAQNSAPPVPAPLVDTPYPGTMVLEVDATDVARAIYSVRQTIPVAQPGRLTLRYPEWLPGKHAPRGEISSLAGLAFTSNGRNLEWRRDPGDVYAFHVEVPQGVRSVEARFQFLSATRPAEGRIVITPAMLNLQFEQVSLYPAGYATRAIPVRPSVILPPQWIGVAALDGLRVRGNRYDFGVTDYETLVDSPMFAGAHYRQWALSNAVVLNVFADEARFLAATPEQIAAHTALVDEAVALFGSRPFDRYEFLLALTEEMGGVGLEHHRSSENTRETDYFTEWASNGSERGLLPHELTHSWNGKYRRPAGLWTADFETPMDARLLWVYEGQTAYWDLLLAGRSGMQTPEMLLGEIARHAATYQTQTGRAWRSVEDTTLDPVIAARRPRPFASATRVEDYYNESALVWLEADMMIRQMSGGQRSMDDFARSFFGGRDGDWGTVTYTFEDVVAAMNAVVPYDWATFLDTRINQPGQPAPLGGIERGGYRLVWRDTANVFDAERMKEGKTLDLLFSLGVAIDNKAEVTSVLVDSPMFAMGVTNGTKILAVNGMAYSDERMKLAIAAAMDGRTPIALVVQKGDRVRTITPVWTRGLRYPHLERVSDGPTLLDALFTPRRAGL